jgi:putative transposase
MRRTLFVEGEFYHLYNRGVDKRVVFTTHADYKRFLAYLFILNDARPVRAGSLLRSNWKPPEEKSGERDPLVALGAFCLMPNHFHLYVTPLQEGGISKFMQRLQTAYTMYFNEKNERSGALFQGTFKAEHVGRDAYAKYLFSYIHLNPAKIKDPAWKERGPRDLNKLAEFIQEYPYSSLSEYITERHSITDPSKFPNYLSNINEVEEHIHTWLQFRDVQG